MRALIAGAGIGGLTAALFLHRAGFEVKIFERAGAVRELGVGINMLPHAVEALADLGLLAALDAVGIRTRELIYTNRQGQVVWQEPRGIEAGHAAPQFSLSRGALLGLLHRAVVDRLGGDAIRTGSRLQAFDPFDDGVGVELRRPDGSLDRAEGGLLIGADGIHSAVRAQLYPQEGPPVWSGIMLWRGATWRPTWRDGRTMVIAGGSDAKFVYYPIACDVEAGAARLTNWAVMARVAEPGATPPRREDWNRPGRKHEILPFVRDRFHLDFVDPAAVIDATSDVYEYPCCDRDPLPRWSFGHASLLGDAAHPMYPVGSNGASQAILDARCLADCLGAERRIDEGLARYDAERRPATEAIVRANRRGGPEAVIDMIEARAPDGFESIDEVATFAERRAVVQGYAALAGFEVARR